MNKYRGFVELEIEGKTKGFKFNNNASAIYCESKGMELGELKNELKFSDEEKEKIKNNDFSPLRNVHMTYWRDMIWAAHAGYQRARGQEVPNQEMVGEWIEEMEQKDFDKLISAFVMSSSLGESFGAKLVSSIQKMNSRGQTITDTALQN